MISQNAKKNADACRFCWMCRHVCPVGQVTGKEANTARAKGLLISTMERGTKYDADMAEVMYECMLCGSCADNCVTGYDPLIYIREARSKAVVEDLVPPYVQKVIDNVSGTGNIYGASKKKYDESPLNQEVLLYIGDVGACREQEMADAVISLLKKAGIQVCTLPDEPSSGTFLGDLIGYVEEVRSQAAVCAIEINATGVKTVVVLDSYDTVTFKQHYPEWGCEIQADVITVTAFISNLINEGRLIPKKMTGRVTYHDDSRLARYLNEYEEARNIITALGLELQEMFQNRNLAKCCGSSLFKAYVPELALLTSEARWNDVRRAEVDTLVVASPEAKEVLGSNIPVDMKLLDLFVLLDKACVL